MLAKKKMPREATSSQIPWRFLLRTSAVVSSERKAELINNNFTKLKANVSCNPIHFSATIPVVFSLRRQVLGSSDNTVPRRLLARKSQLRHCRTLQLPKRKKPCLLQSFSFFAFCKRWAITCHNRSLELQLRNRSLELASRNRSLVLLHSKIHGDDDGTSHRMDGDVRSKELVLRNHSLELLLRSRSLVLASRNHSLVLERNMNRVDDDGTIH